VARPGRLLRKGDELRITRSGGRSQIVVVRDFAHRHVARAVAHALYEDRTPPPSPEELEQRRLRRTLGVRAHPAPVVLVPSAWSRHGDLVAGPVHELLGRALAYSLGDPSLSCRDGQPAARRYTARAGMTNVYFALTAEFNSGGVVALLASGQAVVFYRIALMSKDGDWVVRETESACRQVRSVLARHGARYRPGAPLHPRWLAGGWSSHFEFQDDQKRRVRCDFVSRPPRIPARDIEEMFSAARGEGPLRVIDPERLILLKQTQRAKDYPVIAEISRLLPPAAELAGTTDPDRILALAASHGEGSPRPSVKAAREGRPREQVVVELAREIDRMQGEDRARMRRYEDAARPYLAAWSASVRQMAPLDEAHEIAVGLAQSLLPETPGPVA